MAKDKDIITISDWSGVETKMNECTNGKLIKLREKKSNYI